MQIFKRSGVGVYPVELSSFEVRVIWSNLTHNALHHRVRHPRVRINSAFCIGITVLASMLMATFMHLMCLTYRSHTCVERVRNDGDHVPNLSKGITVVRLNQAKGGEGC